MRVLKVLLFFSVLICLSCQKNIKTPKPIIEDVEFYDYLGLHKGSSMEYNVTEIHHDEKVGVHDTLKYKLKTIVGDTFTSLSKGVSHHFYRYIFKNGDYQLSDVWYSYILDNQFVIVEENIPLIKIKLPLKEDADWDENRLNNLGYNQLIITAIHKPFKLNAMKFDSTILVKTKIVSSMIDFRKKIAIYSKGKGLVYSAMKNLVISNFDTLSIVKGDEIFYELIK